MPKKTKSELSREEDSFVDKKKRKSVVIPFLICLLIAFAIWLYATNAENEKREEEQNASATAQVELCPDMGVDAL